MPTCQKRSTSAGQGSVPTVSVGRSLFPRAPACLPVRRHHGRLSLGPHEGVLPRRRLFHVGPSRMSCRVVMCVSWRWIPVLRINYTGNDRRLESSWSRRPNRAARSESVNGRPWGCADLFMSRGEKLAAERVSSTGASNTFPSSSSVKHTGPLCHLMLGPEAQRKI